MDAIKDLLAAKDALESPGPKRRRTAAPEGTVATPAPDPSFVALLTALGVQGHAGALCAAHVRCEDDLRLLGMEDCKELGFSIGERNRVAHWAGTAPPAVNAPQIPLDPDRADARDLQQRSWATQAGLKLGRSAGKGLGLFAARSFARGAVVGAMVSPPGVEPTWCLSQLGNMMKSPSSGLSSRFASRILRGSRNAIMPASLVHLGFSTWYRSITGHAL